MNREQILALWQRIGRAIRDEEQQRQAPSVSPVSRYLDSARAAAETEVLKRLPVAVVPSASVARPGDWLTRMVHGVPILMTRGEDGRLRAFINVCRHRGALLTPVGTRGHDKSRFVCPYHSWTYANDGRCVGRPHEADFPHAPREESALVAVPCIERLGLVWIVATPGERFDWDSYFAPLADELDGLGFDGEVAAPYGREFTHASNWKLVLDANLETHHVSYAHRNSIASMFYNNLVLNDQYGDHQRIILPKRSCAELTAAPDTFELLGRHVNMIYFFFPATLLLWEGDHINGFSLSPTAIDKCEVNAWFLVPQHLLGLRSEAYWTKNYDIFWNAIDEDFALAASMQIGLSSGANAALRFGANEFPCDAFHRSVETHLGMLEKRQQAKLQPLSAK